MPIDEKTNLDPLKQGSARVDFIYRQPKALSLHGGSTKTVPSMKLKAKLKLNAKHFDE
jgi:hypothetical protein